MRKNSYVTAALFVVFVLLTALYINLPGDNTSNLDYTAGGQGNLPLLTPTDAQTVGELDEDGELASGDEIGNDETPQRVDTNQALRAEAATQRSQREEELTAVIASPDSDAEVKSAAKDELDAIRTLGNSQRMLETALEARGFDDVLVRATETAVNVTVQLENNDEEMNQALLHELHVLAALEFPTHPVGSINITFSSIN